MPQQCAAARCSPDVLRTRPFPTASAQANTRPRTHEVFMKALRVTGTGLKAYSSRKERESKTLPNYNYPSTAHLPEMLLGSLCLC